ncbi:hypothetical protein HDU90_009002 [Geranomyces variabilis]|nr:hypothetical protein HDU90_009002 [Geranomyces variabilis]
MAISTRFYLATFVVYFFFRKRIKKIRPSYVLLALLLFIAGTHYFLLPHHGLRTPPPDTSAPITEPPPLPQPLSPPPPLPPSQLPPAVNI